MRSKMLLVTAALLLAVPVHAQTSAESARADAEAIASASGFDAQLESSTAIMAPLVSSAVLGGMAAEEQGDVVLAAIDASFPGGRNAFAERFTSEFVEKFRLRFPEMRSMMVTYLVDHMTAEHLAATRAFLESEAGQAYNGISVPMQEHMSAEGERIGEEIAMAVLPEMLELMSKNAGNKP